jgi:tight adherence protein C
MAGTDRIAAPRSLADRMVAAGSPGGLRVRDWTALKFAAAVAGLAAGGLSLGSLPGRLGLVVVPAAAAAGFVLPDFWLARVARLRADAAMRELPGMLDLLRVTVAAGRSPVAAMGLVGERFDGPLAAEWRAAAAQVALGVPQDVAVAQIASSIPTGGVRAFVDTVTFAGRAGMRLTDSLVEQATAARHQRRQQIRERAARAGPKVQLVVALVLVPSVMLTLAALLAAEFSGTGAGLGY